MILDKHLIFSKSEDGAITNSRAICLTQNDLPFPNNGLAPYEGLFLCVISGEDVSGLTVTLEHSDSETGTFEALATYPPATVKEGEIIVKAPIPFKAKNWLRINLSSSARVHAFLTTGVDKGVIIDD